MQTDYQTNNSTEAVLTVKSYSCTETALTCAGNYPNGSLFIVKTTDEDGNVSYEFKDKTGTVLITRQQTGSEYSDTYHVYDQSGNVRFVLPPLAADALTGSNTTWNEDNTTLKKYAYIYKYDKYNRCIYKKLPGCEPVYTVYDKADRPIFTQDGVQRDKGEWSFSIPDAFGRVAVSGTCKNTLNYVTNPLDASIAKATLTKTTNSTKGYIISGITLNTPVTLTANYYDTYDFIGQNDILASTTAYETVADYGKRYSGGCRGQQTGSLIARLSKTGSVTSYLYSVLYYDERGRLIQQKGNNELNGTNQIYTAYSFTGKPTQVKQLRAVPGKDTTTELRKHTYDHADRLLRTTYQLNSDPVVTLVDNVYDEAGRLKTDRRNGNTNLKTDYAYNVRSWTKSITGPLFNQTLCYQEKIEGNTPCYNGNISSMLWKSNQSVNESGYRFTYDGLNRLKGAIYGETNTLLANQNRFNEQITGYDKMGNILGLTRYGQTSTTEYGLIDNLTLTYDGNQLQTVKDAATKAVYGNGTEFKNGTNQAIEYTYDKNGNLIKDLNRNITSIQYNSLNLSSQVVFGSGNTLSYEYGADGRKLRTVHVISGVTSTTDYCGNAIYENGVLKMLLNESGYVNLPDKKFHFYLKDHQGNVRLVADKDGNVKETNSYYPFGGTFTSNTNIQPYKYNGKELDRKKGLDWYDYGARMYDAAIGRWHAVDPMAEKRYLVSPYNYCQNNPINRMDIGGKWDIAVHVYRDRENFGYGFLVVTDKSGNAVYNTTVRVEGSNSKKNDYNKRIRTRTNADTPTGEYNIRGWSKRLSKKNRGAYGPNAVLELDYVSGEAAGLRDGMHLHGGRQEGKGGKGKGSTLKPIQGCLRIYDEDIATMKRVTDLLEENDLEEKGNGFSVIDDLERIDNGPHPRPYDYPRKKDESDYNVNEILYRFLRENPSIKVFIN